MKKCHFILFMAAFIVNSIGTVNATLINFDDRAGMPGPFILGESIPPEYMVNDEYLSEGVKFDTDGGGIFLAAPDNPVSSPNTANGTSFGATIDWNAIIQASFWFDSSIPATVDSVSITLSDSSSSAVLEAYNFDGVLLGSANGGALGTLTVNFSGSINSVILRPDNAAFDDFVFEGLTPIPEPGTICLLGVGCIALARRRRA